jgi:hypothetical protein
LDYIELGENLGARVSLSLPNGNVTKLNVDDDGFVDCDTRDPRETFVLLYIDNDNWHAP